MTAVLVFTATHTEQCTHFHLSASSQHQLTSLSCDIVPGTTTPPNSHCSSVEAVKLPQSMPSQRM